MATTNKNAAKAGDADGKDEVSYLRQNASSLAMRGHYKECFRFIEDNLKTLYVNERWPDKFFSILTLHKRCFLSMEINRPYEKHLEELLRKNNIPAVYAQMLTGGAGSITWTPNYFRDLALESRAKRDYEIALGYAEVMIKTDPLNSHANLLKGWILRDLKRTQEAAESLERALELNKTNYQAIDSLCDIYTDTDPQKALDLIEDAIARMPEKASFQASKARALLRKGDAEGALNAYYSANLLDPLNPEYVYQAAELLLSSGQNVAAARQYGRAVGLDEKHIPSLMRLAGIASESQPELALSYITTVSAAQPENRDASLLKAKLLERTGKSQAAIRQYKAHLERDGSCAEACGALGRLYLNDSPETSLLYYAKAAELRPSNAEYYLGKGKACERANKTEDAVLSYKAAIAHDKRCAGAYAALGYLHMEKNPKSAMSYFNKAIELDPENPYYYQEKGKLLMELPNSGPDALACYDKAVKLDPGNSQLRHILAKLLEESGRQVSAIDHYRAAAGLDPNFEDAYYRLARLLKEREPVAALLNINHAISLNMTRAEYYYLKACIFSRLGSDPDALREIRRSLLQDQVNHDAVQEFHQLLDGEAPRVAMMHINQALEITPNNPVFLCVRGELLWELSEPVKAQAQYKKALEIDPHCHEAMFGIGKIFAGKGDKKALEYLDRAIALAPATARYHAEKALFLANDPDRYQAALECLDNAIAIDKGLWNIALVKARLLEKYGELFAAMHQYRIVLLIFRDCLEANVRLGVLLAGLNRVAALAYLTRAAELEPENYIHYVRKAGILHGMGNEAGAEAELEKALHIGGETDGAYFGIAQALYESAPRIALGYCERAMEMAPEKAEYPLLLGNIHRILREYESAKECYLTAIKLAPSCHEALARTAEIYLRYERPESLDMINRAIEQNSGDAWYHYIRGMICSEQLMAENIPEAIKSIREAVRLAPGEVAYQEKLAELLKKSRAPLQYFMEKRRLDKLRRELRELEEEAVNAAIV